MANKRRSKDGQKTVKRRRNIWSKSGQRAGPDQAGVVAPGAREDGAGEALPRDPHQSHLAGYRGRIPVKILVKQWSNTGQTLAKYTRVDTLVDIARRAGAGEATLAQRSSAPSDNLTKRLRSNAGQTRVKRGSNAGQTRVKRWSNARQTVERRAAGRTRSHRASAAAAATAAASAAEAAGGPASSPPPAAAAVAAAAAEAPRPISCWCKGRGEGC
jgi:hypothetical protein